jgi:hypothetical protein
MPRRVDTGSHQEQEAASRQRLYAAAPWIQTVKVADIISSSAIAEHDRDHARKYLAEKRAMLPCSFEPTTALSKLQ